MIRLLSVVYEARDDFGRAREEAGNGYENPLLLEGLGNRPYDPAAIGLIDTPVFFGHAMAALAVVAARTGRRTVRVLDVGGATGAHHAVARATFADAYDLRWTVLETPLYVAHGRRTARDPHVRFMASLDEVAEEQFDLAYFSASLPYVPDLEALLTATPVAKAAFIYISRTPLDETERPFLQTVTYDAGVVHYAGRVLPRRVLSNILSHSHELTISWQNEQFSVEHRNYPAPSMLWQNRSFPKGPEPASIPRGLRRFIRRLGRDFIDR